MIRPRGQPKPLGASDVFAVDTSWGGVLFGTDPDLQAVANTLDDLELDSFPVGTLSLSDLDEDMALSDFEVGTLALSELSNDLDIEDFPIVGADYTEVLFNNGGTLDGVPNLTWDGTDLLLSGPAAENNFTFETDTGDLYLNKIGVEWTSSGDETLVFFDETYENAIIINDLDGSGWPLWIDNPGSSYTEMLYSENGTSKWSHEYDSTSERFALWNYITNEYQQEWEADGSTHILNGSDGTRIIDFRSDGNIWINPDKDVEGDLLVLRDGVSEDPILSVLPDIDAIRFCGDALFNNDYADRLFKIRSENGDAFALSTTDDGTLTLGASLSCTDDYGHSGTNWGIFGSTPTTQPTALTASDASSVDATYGNEERDVIINLRTRVDELETKLQAIGVIA